MNEKEGKNIQKTVKNPKPVGKNHIKWQDKAHLLDKPMYPICEALISA